MICAVRISFLFLLKIVPPSLGNQETKTIIILTHKKSFTKKGIFLCLIWLVLGARFVAITDDSLDLKEWNWWFFVVWSMQTGSFFKNVIFAKTWFLQCSRQLTLFPDSSHFWDLYKKRRREPSMTHQATMLTLMGVTTDSMKWNFSQR